MSAGSSFLPQLLASFGATLGAFSLGNVLSWTATALPDMKEEGELVLSTSQEAQVVAIFMIGSAIVPLVAAISFPLVGKKWFLISLSLPFIAGWVVLLLASSFWMLLIGRFLTGFSGGAFVLAAPAYIAEIAEAKYRGTLSTLMQLMVTIGILFNNALCGRIDWKLLSGLSTIFPGLLAVWMFFMPRSPVFLVSKGDLEGARGSLQFLRGKDAKVETELQQIVQDMKKSKEIGTISPLAIWQKEEYLKPMGISLVLMALQQLSGINYVMGYSTIIFKSTGSSMDPCSSAMVLGAVQVVGTLITTLIIEKFGRKILLLVSDLMVCVSMVGMIVFFKLKETCSDCDNSTINNSTMNGVEVYVEKTTVDSIGWLPLVSLVVFLLSFSIGFGPVPWVLNVELMPPEARSTAASICTSFNWLISYMVALCIPMLGEAINPSNCYIIFSAIAGFGSLFVLIFVPETKGKSEAEIRRMFISRKKEEVDR